MENEHRYNGWVEYKERVIFQLTQLTDKTTSIENKLDALRTDVTILKVKAGIYGAVGGFVITIIVNIIIALFHAKVL